MFSGRHGERLGLLLGALVSGCVILPMGATYITGSVGLESGVPAFISPGRTTRADLWRVLGPAYREAQDKRWLCYGALFDVTGYVAIAQGGGTADRRKLEIRSLIVNLDAADVVERVRFNTISCRRVGAPSFAYRCVGESGREMPEGFWYETDLCVE